MGEQEIKLEAGEAIAYSAGSVHRVNPVTRGARLGCHRLGAEHGTR